MFPVSGEPIADGVVTVDGPRIVAVGERASDAVTKDLGNVAILPGLVNAHTHLEFSDLDVPLGTPGIAFVDWLSLVIESFRQADRQVEAAIRTGLQESLRLGTTLLGEIAQPGWPCEEFERAELDATVFLELIAPTADRMTPLFEVAEKHVRAEGSSGCPQPGLSPHAPYSVFPPLFEQAVSLSATYRVPLAFHLAESREEMQLLRSGTGPLCDYFETLGTCEAELFAAGRKPLDYLRLLAKAHRTLVIHGNYLDDEEIALLADRADRMAVVYCPRTHAYFGHEPYPLRQMIDAGALVAVGTDSRASSPDLSVLAELRTIAANHPTIGPDVVLRLGTLNGAQALGRSEEAGSLEVGKLANLTFVALPDHDTDPYRLLFDSDLPVTGVSIKGTGSGPVCVNP